MRCAGFVDDVDGFIGKFSRVNVANGELHSGFEGVVAKAESVVVFVARFESPKDSDGVV